MNYIVYKHTSPSGNSYVGYTKLTLEKRWKHKINESRKSTSPFARAIAKYGTDNWNHEILVETTDITFAHSEEKRLILLYGYYNIAAGGDGGDTGKNSDPVKIEKQRVSIKKHLKELPESEKHRRQQASMNAKIVNGTLGNNNPHFGKKHGNWDGYWYVFNVRYETLTEAVKCTKLNESTVLDICVNKVDKCWTRTSKVVPKGKTPRDCGHYKGK